MRRRSVVAMAALIAAFALAGLPAPAGSTPPSTAQELAPAAFTTVTIPATAQAAKTQGRPDPARRSEGYVDARSVLAEPAEVHQVPDDRPRVDQPLPDAGQDWKAPAYSIAGYATFYDHGTTAMRLPRGTLVRICGEGGCIERTVTDYGPQKPSRVVDLYTPDFCEICGCPWFSGTTWVTVSVY
jgi:hypothetical protein